ncbi:Nal1-like putative serine protease [Deminuibacter soli]|uniref:Nal1 C-terminal domain-containing protein n=1 Tax=Deminuibacter soli TaxID=2291815 RepID=A0A3E1NK47_9BACT|nr:hypothetical protein [Deminuibacter soli]RFM28310.1 hypothetical protein DXN05_12425 [Deminuibacter soli]
MKTNSNKDGQHFSSLSIKDLIDARALFHVHLMNKRNVIATAVGLYRIRKSDIDNGVYKPDPSFPRKERRLDNSVVLENFSWPCVMVFVKEWEPETALIHNGENNIIPRTIYMPDGRVVPICIIKAPRSQVTQNTIDASLLRFPRNLISGGFPLIVHQQGEKRIASVGCVVSDGNTYYALSNKHVVGKPGTPVYSVFRGIEKRIGVSSGITLGKSRFSALYPGWISESMLINNDVGLIEIDDINSWKTAIYSIGTLGELEDLNTNNFSLSLINRKVKAYGAVSGGIKGEIVGLFYRYQSIGGIEYVSDFLLGGENGQPLNVHHGDSGSVFVTEETDADTNTVSCRPLALLWGMHEFIEGKERAAKPYVMATSLSNACRELDINIVRDWNLDQDYTWAKDGHFKIGNRSCELVTDTRLHKLLAAHKYNVGYSDHDLIDQTNIAKAQSTSFIPLADVPDLYWRYKRFKTEGNNHFADMDESDPQVMDGKDLLTLCKSKSFVDIAKWVAFYKEMDIASPKTKVDSTTGAEVLAPRMGSLPFRVWQLYTQMVRSLKNGNVAEYLVAGGTMTHYVGDACQPLHVSYLHAGIPGQESNVHGEYEDKMIASNRETLFTAVNALDNKVKATQLVTGGHEAAAFVISLMRKTFTTLPPMDIIEAFGNVSGRGKYAAVWKVLGKKTIKVIASGANAMAVLWQSAWVEGNGKAIPASKYAAITTDELQAIYEDYRFVQSFNITDAGFQHALENDTRTL